MKKIAILGSTGSIGTQTLEVARENGDIKVCGLAAGNNIALLEKQIREFAPKLAAVWSEEKARELRVRIADTDTQVVSGMDGLLKVSTLEDAEILVTAIVGMIGIRPTIEAIKAGKDIALANKETLVTAGHIIMPLAKEKKVSILPVDSEHSAIFQSLQGNEPRAVHKILLTASGGPFRGRKEEELLEIRVEDALKHPNWSMGQKITIDSSTMVNKGLEVIEAHWLFNLPYEQIEVIIHPESIIHSMVQYRDGALLAQLSYPDMCLPIQYALSYPERWPNQLRSLNFAEIASLTFQKPDEQRFPCFRLAREAGLTGGTMPAVLSGANEALVSAFLAGRIRLGQIADGLAAALAAHQSIAKPDLPAIVQADSWARNFVTEWLHRHTF